MVELQNQDQDSYKAPQKGYYKKSWKKWLLIYVVVGIVVYGIVYLVIAYGAESSDNDSTNSTSSSLY